ncbi:MAG: ABC transporter substrate-binding protein [Actinomycetota bacterium]
MSVSSAATNPALSAKLPQKIADAKEIVIGVDASYAPNEFLAADGKTVQGLDVDLFNAVAQKFGVKTTWVPANFDSIITGVQGGKYDIGVSSFTINDERKKQVNMVSYFSAGTQWATATGNPKKVAIDDACGLKVAVQKGTVQADEDLPPRQEACKEAGEPAIEILSYTGQDQATAALVSGKADAMLADSPITAYAVKQANGAIALLGEVYDSAPYGYVVPKDQAEFAQALADALTELNTEKTYQSALAKWGSEAGAISDFAVNP